MLLCMGIRYSFWQKAAPLLLLFSLLLLALVLIAGTEINGGKRWFVVGGFNFQPSELAKFTMIIYLAALISKKGDKLRNLQHGLLPILIVVGLILLLVLRQPDFGTVLILLFISSVMILTGGARIIHLAVIALALVPVFVYLSVSKSYRLERMNAFLNPFASPYDTGYQLIQSLYALGHGGITGTGIGKSVQKRFYLPEAHTDFIYAVVGEELGFIGSMLLFAVFLLYIWRGLWIAVRSSDVFGMMTAIGIVAMIMIQFLLNIGAVTGSLPITGVPLPFISYGGSSLLLNMTCTGILLSVSREVRRRA